MMIIRQKIRQQQALNKTIQFREKALSIVLFLFTSISILTTISFVLILFTESIEFFKRVSLIEFYTGKILKPLSEQAQFGILPLLLGTIIATLIAMLIAIPIGLMIAIYLSEFAHEKIRKVIKPILEVLAGIPTIVYGFFALTFVTPLLGKFITHLELTNILSPGLVMGIMILPMIASMSEDAMKAVPQHLKDGAIALGATRWEVTRFIVLPAALSGIIASFVLGISRAIGETMIVTIASGSSKNLTFDVTQSMQTMTAYIVEVMSGDAPVGSTIYYSLYAVAMTLFIFTLTMNLIAQYISRKLREDY